MTKTNKQQFEELKDLITQTNDKINDLQTQISDNHKNCWKKFLKLKKHQKKR